MSPESPMETPKSQVKRTVQIRDPHGKITYITLIEKLSIGRGDENAVTIKSRDISRNHAQIVVGDDGKVRIEDLESYNGVKVNGYKIGEATPIGTGDRIHIGEYLLWVETEGGEDETRPYDAPTVRISKEELP